MDVRAETVRFFEMGFANKAVGRLPGIPQATVIKWLYTYRALGKETLFVTKYRTYPHALKVEAAKAVVEERMSKPEAMKVYGLKSRARSIPGAGSVAKEAQMRCFPSRRGARRRSR